MKTNLVSLNVGCPTTEEGPHGPNAVFIDGIPIKHVVEVSIGTIRAAQMVEVTLKFYARIGDRPRRDIGEMG